MESKVFTFKELSPKVQWKVAWEYCGEMCDEKIEGYLDARLEHMFDHTLGARISLHENPAEDTVHITGNVFIGALARATLPADVKRSLPYISRERWFKIFADSNAGGQFRRITIPLGAETRAKEAADLVEYVDALFEELNQTFTVYLQEERENTVRDTIVELERNEQKLYFDNGCIAK